MKKRVFRGFIILVFIILIGLFLYASQGLLDPSNYEIFVKSVSIVMLLVILLGILILFVLFQNGSQDKIDGKVTHLVGRKVYTSNGDAVGEISDVLISSNVIYGLKVKFLKKTKKKKAVILAKDVVNYGEVIIVDSRVLD